MKVKVGTTLKAELYERVLQHARIQGIRVNEVFEEALAAYLCNDPSEANHVAETFGSYRVGGTDLEEIVNDDIYEY